MSRRRPPFIPLRRPVYIGCEGASEVSYAGFLQKKRSAPAERFALLDSDQAERDPERAKKLAADNDIVLLWQEPCFEAMLLRHLEGKTGNRPPDMPGAIKALEKEWAGYEKPLTRVNLAKRIDLAAVLRAAGVEPDLTALLRCIGLITD